MEEQRSAEPVTMPVEAEQLPSELETSSELEVSTEQPGSQTSSTTASSTSLALSSASSSTSNHPVTDEDFFELLIQCQVWYAIPHASPCLIQVMELIV